MSYKIIQGDNRETLKTIPDNSIDAIVTDPPYGIDFLGKAWDVNTGELETYQECLRVLKPGGHILAFSAARTYHHLAMTLERAGFEIRDQIMWIYSSGFPKSQDVGKSIERSQGKRKKLKNVNSSNIVGIGTQCPQCGKYENGSNQKKCQSNPCPLKEALKPADNEWAGWGTNLKPAHEPIALARKPLKQSIAKNVQKWGTGAINIDACRIATTQPPKKQVGYDYGATIGGADPLNRRAESNIDHQYEPNEAGRFPSNVLGEIPDYQKYFYCPKVSRKERHMGFDEDEKVGNNHPTVKPVALMEYLIKLITPPGGTVLDPYNGSGSTGMAAVELGYNYIGCELDPKYVEISEKRIEAWISNGNNFDELFEE